MLMKALYSVIKIIALIEFVTTQTLSYFILTLLVSKINILKCLSKMHRKKQSTI